MGLETVYYVPDINHPNYKTKMFNAGTYFCYSKDCNGKQVILFGKGQLKPRPKCGGHIFFTT